MSSFFTRTLLVAANTAGEAVRQRYFLISGLLAAAVAGLSSTLRMMHFGEDLKFTADIGFGAVFFFGSLLAVVLPVHLFFAEIDNRTALTLLARPMRRSEFLAGKWLGVWALLAGLVVIVSSVTIVLAAMRHAELLANAEARHSAAPVFELYGAALFVLLQIVRLGVVAALTLLVCSYARTALFAFGAGFGWLVIGQTGWLAREWLGVNDSPAREILIFVLRAVPDLQSYNLADALVFPKKAAPIAEAWLVAGSGLVWIVAIIAVASWFFKDREL